MTRLRISLLAGFGTFLMIRPQPALAQNGAVGLSAGWRVLNSERQRRSLRRRYRVAVSKLNST